MQLGLLFALRGRDGHYERFWSCGASFLRRDSRCAGHFWEKGFLLGSIQGACSQDPDQQCHRAAKSGQDVLRSLTLRRYRLTISDYSSSYAQLRGTTRAASDRRFNTSYCERPADDNPVVVVCCIGVHFFCHFTLYTPLVPRCSSFRIIW